MVSMVPLSLLKGMLNLMTVSHAWINLRYSSGIPVFLAALSKNSLTCSKNLGSSCSSSLGPNFYDEAAVVEKDWIPIIEVG